MPTSRASAMWPVKWCVTVGLPSVRRLHLIPARVAKRVNSCRHMGALWKFTYLPRLKYAKRAIARGYTQRRAPARSKGLPAWMIRTKRRSHPSCAWIPACCRSTTLPIASLRGCAVMGLPDRNLDTAAKHSSVAECFAQRFIATQGSPSGLAESYAYETRRRQQAVRSSRTRSGTAYCTLLHIAPQRRRRPARFGVPRHHSA